MADTPDRAVAPSGARLIPGHVLDQGGVVLRGRQLEELDLARRAIATAAQKARELLDQAGEQAAQERSRGYQEGLAKARQEAAGAAVALRLEATRLRAEAGDRLIRLAVELAGRIVHHELRTAPDAMEHIARAALAQVSWCQRITLRLHPDDAPHLTAAQPRLAEALDAGTELRLETDPGLAPGACLVETEAGDVDASVEVQLAALERALLDADATPSPLDPPPRGSHE